MKGVIQNVVADKGYCFITPADAKAGTKNIFCHVNYVVGKNEAFDTFESGVTQVTFDIATGPKGDSATNVTIVD